MARGQDAVEPLPALVVLDPVYQYVFRRRHVAPTMGESMQALKALVVFMAVLIVIGMVILAYGISLRFGKMAGDEAAPPPPRAGAIAPWPGDLAIAVPAGAQVADTVVAEGRMIVRLALPDGGNRFIVVDLATGTTLGAVELTPQGGTR